MLSLLSKYKKKNVLFLDKNNFKTTTFTLLENTAIF